MRQTSAVFDLASCSRSTAMIYSSANLVRFIFRPLPVVRLYPNQEEIQALTSGEHPEVECLRPIMYSDAG